MSCAGLVPVMTLATQTGLPQLLADKVRIAEPRIKSGSANPSPKLTTVIAGICAGADCIDDLDVVRSGGMKALFDGVYAPSTIGTLLREFTFGHARQLESVLREHLAELCERVPLLPGAAEQAFIDIDSLLRPVYGHAKQGASYGHTKIAGKQILRKGLSPLITTISTDEGAPVIAGARLRAGKTNSGKGAARMVAQAVAAARAAKVTGQILVRGDSAYGNGVVAAACRRAGAQFSLVLTKNRAVAAAIDSISDDAWAPVKYPGAVRDPDTGAWISDAEVAEVPYTAFASTRHAVTARLIVRRVKDARYPDALFPVWRYHPFFTDTDQATAAADITHRRHAVIETVFADLIDGLQAPVQLPDGTLQQRDRGTPQGSPVSPVLANLFLHYAFDAWMAREFPAVRFERYVDDAVVHCVSERQARQVLAALHDRMVEVGLRLHPDKTRIVYCKDGKRRGDYEHTSFTFLGFTFRPRKARSQDGRLFLSFSPAISRDALTKIGREVRSWRLHRRLGHSFGDLARWINPIVRGWMQYYGAFTRSALYPLLTRINAYLMRWVRKKYRRFKGRRDVHQAWRRVAEAYPRYFAHWAWTTAVPAVW